ncbi:MAG: biotin/lipoyl-binding protein [Deltaproteobacteria bacterium]|uniref:Biotin/lipoyl-binding protein n=1 Tax=Candidatus Zymogenus saltonus TaxID=2844893 RepID=A0A9D8KFP5_9DELT|nr:biotin/lipoyl-binding protein [Candidatus Zymogenus saltonus]
MTIFVNEQEMEVSFTAVSENTIRLEIDGRGRTAYVVNSGGEKEIVIDGTPYVVQNADIMERRRGKSGGKAIPTEVTPPMPSVVIRVLVEVGDEVEEGYGVVVVSAMKMETTLFAPFAGKVTKINVSEGDKVEPGQILVDIEREDSGEEGAASGD